MSGVEHLAKLAERVNEASEGTAEREALLERLAAEIREGRYRIETDELAEALIRELERERRIEPR